MCTGKIDEDEDDEDDEDDEGGEDDDDDAVVAEDGANGPGAGGVEEGGRDEGCVLVWAPSSCSPSNPRRWLSVRVSSSIPPRSSVITFTVWATSE